jgi:hypothetical protein
MKKSLKTFSIIFLISFLSCSSDESELTANPKSVTDCELTITPDFFGICLDGAESALPNEIITYASKFTSTNSEILWTIASGNMEIINIETSITTDGLRKSIVTIQFNSNFSGGSINVKGLDNNGVEFAEITGYPIVLEESTP